jgi:hypothetical protein
MLHRFFDIHPEERRVALAAFFVQFGGLAAHTLLETARDALFLARLLAAQLPWMYLAIAALALLVMWWRADRLARGRALPALLGAARTVLGPAQILPAAAQRLDRDLAGGARIALQPKAVSRASAQIRAAAVEHISGTLAVHVRRML